MRGCLGESNRGIPSHHGYRIAFRIYELSLRKLGMTGRKKAGIAPGLSFVSITECCEAYFTSARFGGVAGHDLTSAS